MLIREILEESVQKFGEVKAVKWLKKKEISERSYYEIMENPANYLTYYTGYLEILTMEREARQTLGANYSQLEFNRFLLDMGPAPFGVIRTYFVKWLVK